MVTKLTLPSKENDVQTKINELVDDKQDTLVSGTNIKTINSNSILGSGDLTIDSLPSQTGQSGKYLTTDGTSTSWGTPTASVASDNKSITKNSSNEIQTVGVIDQNNTSSAIKTWTGTRAQYDAIVTKDANTLYNTDNGLFLGTTQIANLSSVRNIGEVVQSTIPLSDAGLHLLDGSLISGSGAYSAFVTYIAGLYNDDPTASYFAQSHGEIDWVQPVATGSTTAIDGGDMVITTSNEYSTYNSWKAMDGIKSGTNAATGWGVNNTSATQWWQLKLPYQIRITGIKVYHRYDTTPANANVVGRFYTSSNMTTPIGDTLNDTSATNWQEFTISGIPSSGIVTDTLYFRKTGGGTYGGLGEVEITATVVGTEQTAEQVWQQSVTNYGVCGKFVYDSVNNTVRLPKITGFIEGTTDVTALGDLVEAGLPNITGSVLFSSNNSNQFIPTDSFNGCLYGTDTATKSNYLSTATAGGSSVERARQLNVDASRSNPIYGGSNTVQPQAIKVLYYIVIANSVKTNIEVDIDEVMTDLNGKADVDLSNITASGKSLACGWGMPSGNYENLTSTSGSTYTAPANGYVVFKNNNTGTSNVQAYIENTTKNIISTVSSYYNNGGGFVPVNKGDTVYIYRNSGVGVVYYRFIYAEGEV